MARSERLTAQDVMRQVNREIQGDKKEASENEGWRQNHREKEAKNNIPFIWGGDDTTDTYSEEITKQALRFAGREDLLFDVDNLYITNQKQSPGSGPDSRALSVKYGENAKLVKGETYYLCQQ